MNKPEKYSVSASISMSVGIALITGLCLSLGGQLLSSLAAFVQPGELAVGPAEFAALAVFGVMIGIVAEKFEFVSFVGIMILFLGGWFAASAAAANFLKQDLMFLPIFLVSVMVIVLTQFRRLTQFDSKLTEKMLALSTSDYLMEGKTPDSRVESALKLLETVLPLSEVIVFQYEASGELNSVGRSRSPNSNESMSARQNSWRKSVELCDRALRTRQTVIEYVDQKRGAARIALPLINENVLVGGLFVNVKEKFERNDSYLLESLSEQLARNFQRKMLGGERPHRKLLGSFLSTEEKKFRNSLANLINGLIKEQSFGVVATSYINEAHAIAYLDGTIAYVNRRMRHLANIAPREIHEINLFGLLDRFRTEVFCEPAIAVRRVMQTGSTFERELQFPEREITLNIEITLVKIAANVENVHDTEVPKKPACFLITLRDVTARKENENLRSDLVNMMSHELRTPITSIQGFAEMLLLDDNIPSESREFLNFISKESQRAANLLSNFLSVANLQQSDKQDFQKSPVRVNQIVEELVENMQPAAKQKRIRLVEKSDDYLPPIAADRGLLTKAIAHLIDNALRYSPERSSVIISTMLESDFLKVEVEDRGYGIPVAEQEKIWNKFYRVAREGKDKEGDSTGLGLSIVKEIIEQHAGTIGVESEPGRGSKFSVRIPR